jgi:flagellin
MALIIPPNSPSTALDGQIGVNQPAKPTSKGVSSVHAPSGAAVKATEGAGLAISEAARIQIRSLAAAERNANDVIAMAQTANGALGHMGGLLERMRKLAVDDSGGKLSVGAREDAKLEFSKLRDQVDGIQKSATYDGRALLGAEEIEIGFDVALDGNASDRLAVTLGGFGPLTLLAASAHPSAGPQGASDSMVGRIDHALAAISDQRARFSATVTRFADTAATVQTARASRAAGSAPIIDASAAEELANLCKSQIVGQGKPALLTQANQLPAHAMSLLQD